MTPVNQHNSTGAGRGRGRGRGQSRGNNNIARGGIGMARDRGGSIIGGRSTPLPTHGSTPTQNVDANATQNSGASIQATATLDSNNHTIAGTSTNTSIFKNDIPTMIKDKSTTDDLDKSNNKYTERGGPVGPVVRSSWANIVAKSPASPNALPSTHPEAIPNVTINSRSTTTTTGPVKKRGGYWSQPYAPEKANCKDETTLIRKVPAKDKWSQQQQSFFFRLPLELRETIYLLVLGLNIRKLPRSNVSAGHSWKHRYPATDPAWAWTHPLSRVCSSVRNEMNHFLVPGLQLEVEAWIGNIYLTEWLDSMTTDVGYERVRSLEFSGFGYFPGISPQLPKNGDLELIKKCTGLTWVKLYFNDDSFPYNQTDPWAPTQYKWDEKSQVHVGQNEELSVIKKYGFDQLLSLDNLEHLILVQRGHTMLEDTYLFLLRKVGNEMITRFAEKGQDFKYEVRHEGWSGDCSWDALRYTGSTKDVLKSKGKEKVLRG